MRSTAEAQRTLADSRLRVIAHRDEEIRERLERMGLLGFLHKPFEPHTLQDEVERLLSPTA